MILAIFTLVTVFLFSRAFYLFHQEYRSSINGNLVKIKKGSKASNYFTIVDSNTTEILTYDFKGRDDVLKKVNIGDSCSKSANSYFISFYKKANSQYYLIDSFEFWHY